MEVYVEYAIVENFLIDGMLLWLSLKMTKRKISFVRLFFAAALGAAFAVIFPLFSLGAFLGTSLKLAVGALLVFVAIGENGWGRYALSLACFYGASFALGGGLIAVYDLFSLPYIQSGGVIVAAVPLGGVLLGCVLFLATCIWCIKRLYRRRRILRFVYPCKIVLGARTVEAFGFLDSGNRATVMGKKGDFRFYPLHFLSPDLAFQILDGREPVSFAETAVTTVGGKKQVKFFMADRLEIYSDGRWNIIERAYFAPSSHIRDREYKILLSAHCLDVLQDGDNRT